MRNAKKLSRAERLEIAILLGKQYSLRKIAQALGRSPNTVSEEVRKNTTRRGYDPKRAHEKARLRLRFRRLQWRKIEEHQELRQYVIAKLHAHWNPDEISGRMKKDNLLFFCSKTAIYEWLRSNRGQRYCIYLYSQRYRKKPQKPRTARAMIPNRTSIHKRFAGSTHRTRFGHWEEDTMVSRRWSSTEAAAVFVERKSRLLLVQKLSSLSPRTHADVVQRVRTTVIMKSVTLDNGIENKNHAAYGVPTFFCDPYASWQKGSVENANKMIRRYCPKGTDFNHVSQETLDQIVSIINHKPRKILQYRTAWEVARVAGIIHQGSVLFQG